jgi:hypothetical protein
MGVSLANQVTGPKQAIVSPQKSREADNLYGGSDEDMDNNGDAYGPSEEDELLEEQ